MASKRKSLRVDEKVLLIHAIESGEKICDVGKRFGFSRSTVSTIWKNKEKILQAESEGNSFKKLKKPKYEDLDQAILSWFHRQRQNNRPLSGPLVKAKAENFADELGLVSFKASEGWLGKFKQRHHINYGKLRRKALSVDTNRTLVRIHRVVFEAHGLVPPVFTPLKDDLTINYKVISSYAKYLAVNGIKAVLVGGTTGEHMSLSIGDRKRVIEEWIKAKSETGLHIMVQVGGAPAADVLELAKFCASANVDSLLTLPELYFKPKSVTELVNYVELVAKAAPNLPVLYYHIPSMSKVEINMPAFVVEATARIPNFKGIKFTSNDLSEGAQVKRNLKEGQEMFLGADTLLAPAALLGIKSSIGTSFNLFPKLAQDILDAVAKADVGLANKLQEKLSLAIEAHLPEGDWVPIMKAGMELTSEVKVGPPALPQRPISSEARDRIATRLKALKLI